MKEIEVNVVYCWFLGLDMMDPVPHFSTFGKNYTRRFKDTDLFEQIFSRILEECMKYKLVDTNQIFVDSTHVKACANSKKMRKRVAHEQTLWYEDELKKEIEQDRLAHGKKPLKDKNNHQPPTSGGNDSRILENAEEISDGVKTQKSSTSDPESGWFRKGEHKHVFAYAIETACDPHGWIFGYTVHPENQVLSYRTTNRDGYREYKSCSYICCNCPQKSKCTESKNHVKLVTQHVWERYIEKAEDIRHTLGNKEIYHKRKETIERIFGTAKEHHGFRYTQYIGKARMEMKAGLAFACMKFEKTS